MVDVSAAYKHPVFIDINISYSMISDTCKGVLALARRRFRLNDWERLPMPDGIGEESVQKNICLVLLASKKISLI